eukprot:scaffold1839_cov60-Phaeocystis_antarctica.AAC.4
MLRRRHAKWHPSSDSMHGTVWRPSVTAPCSRTRHFCQYSVRASLSESARTSTYICLRRMARRAAI